MVGKVSIKVEGLREIEAAMREQISRPAPKLSEAMAGSFVNFRFRIANRKETNGRSDRRS